MKVKVTTRNNVNWANGCWMVLLNKSSWLHHDIRDFPVVHTNEIVSHYSVEDCADLPLTGGRVTPGG